MIGNRTKVKVVKNKMAPPFKVAEFDIMYGQGISQSGCVLDMALALGLIKKSGAWFSYNDEKIGQGKENTKLYLEKNPEVLQELDSTIRAKLSGDADVALETDESVDE